ncbi:MAG: hypothetical protein R3301_01670 [Saprospiraceae bacterium]|nr:hypothetical protein [Saprospiraceae bacterium]
MSLQKTVREHYPDLDDLDVVWKGGAVHNASAYANETIYLLSLYGDSTDLLDYQYLVLTKSVGHRSDGRPIEVVCDALKLPKQRNSQFRLCMCDDRQDHGQKTFGVFVSLQEIQSHPEYFYLDNAYSVDTIRGQIIRIRKHQLRCQNVDHGI